MIYGALKSSGGCVNVISNRAYLKEQQTRVELHKRSEQNVKEMMMRQFKKILISVRITRKR
jgi:hypothetical protein